MSDIQICGVCLEAYAPVVVMGVRKLKVINGYTVDFRIQQFRKVTSGEELAFIEFDSKKGQTLLQAMHCRILKK